MGGFSVKFFFYLLIIDNLSQRFMQTEIVPDDSAGISSPIILARIRAVVQNSTAPSWMNNGSWKALPGPSNTYEWRLFCTVYIPVALISLSGAASGSAAVRFRAVLSHTMSLVGVVWLMEQGYTAKECADRYLENIRRYVEGLLVLYPNTSYVPKHHMAFHIYDFLQLFGPANSWCTTPFEYLTTQLKHLETGNAPYTCLQYI